MKIIRYFIWTLLSLILLTTATIAIVINFVFTPSKLSPLIEKTVNENLNAKLALNTVELTFFSTFPNFSVVVKDGSLETLSQDTLVRFKELNVVVDPIALLKNQKVVIHKIELSSPSIHARIDENGVANWDLMKPTIEKEEEVHTDTTAHQPLGVSLSNIRIKDGTIIFDDRQKDIYTELRNVTMSLDGKLAKKLSDAQFSLSFNNALLWQDNKLLIKNLDFSTVATVELNTETKNIKVDTAWVEINTVKFAVGGAINSDSLDVNLSLQVPTLGSVLNFVSFLDKSAKVSTKGEVSLNAHVFGAYKGGAIPVLDASLSIRDAALHYEGYQNGIDKLNIEAKTHINLKGESNLTIDNLHVMGASTSVNLTAKIDDLLKNPKIHYNTNSTINFTELLKTLPLNKEIEMGGKMRINSRGEFSKQQLISSDYAHLNMSGEVKLDRVVFNVPGKIRSGFEMLDLNLSNNKEGLLIVNGKMAKVDFDVKRFAVTLDSIAVIAAGINKKGESFVGGQLDYTNFRGSLYSDSLEVNSGHSAVAFKLNDSLQLNFSTDTLNLRAVDNTFDMSRAKVDIELTKNSLKGKIGFAGIDISVPKFPLPMSMPATILSIDNQIITLKRASFKIGDSDLVMSGVVADLFSASRGEKPLSVKVDVSSSMMNLTQIAHAFNQMAPDTTAVVENETATDTTELNLFKIPKLIDFELNTNFKRLELGKLIVNDVVGKMTLKNGVARLNNLSLNTLGAELATTLVYDSNTSKAGIMIASKSIDVHSVIELVPSLDTLMPMLNSFEGKLNFQLSADTKFYEGFTIHPTELEATIGLHGEDLVLLDGETFAEISKLLMFKNKKRNVVDSISVEMAVNNGAVEVFPFVIQIDRYRAAIGGEHFLTNQFNYHISILKSPIPFKFGVNITGSLDDMKVRIGKTKYKSLNQPNSVHQLNPKYIELGKEIRERIREL